MENATEQEQLEAIRKWWKENGAAIVAGIVIGLGAVIGWQQWDAWQVRQAEGASALYQQATEAIQGGDADGAAAVVEQLVVDYGNSPYAALAQFALARKDIEQNDLQSAHERYRWVVENAAQPEHGDIARLRLARVLLTEGEHAAALGELGGTAPAFFAEVSELKGDIYAAQGDFERAREAYQAAVATLAIEGGSNPWLTMKLESLTAPAEGS